MGISLNLVLLSSCLMASVLCRSKDCPDDLKPIPRECPSLLVLPMKCLRDDGCPGEQVCCVNGCILDCVEPRKKEKKVEATARTTDDTAIIEDDDTFTALLTILEKLPLPDNTEAKCPVVEEKEECPPRGDEECLLNSDCSGKQMCCSDGCGLVCMDVRAPPPVPDNTQGKCPVVEEKEECPPRNEECLLNSDCSGKKMCCSDGCGLVCMDVRSPPPPDSTQDE